MEVYRICFPEEINKIFKNKGFKKVGYAYMPIKENTHYYENHVKYLHFFKQEDSIFYRSTTQGKYICTYDIPKELLDKHFGFGIYHNYFNYENAVLVDEYAIPTSELKIDYLKKVSYITKDIDIYDYIDDNSLSDFLEVIYENNDQQKLTKVRKRINLQ